MPELAELRRDLESLASELASGLESSAQAAQPVELDQPAIGRVSRIDAIQQQKMLEANRAAQKARIGLVRSALDRVRGEAFGDCLVCGEEIGFARLKARPESALCIECQRERETR